MHAVKRCYLFSILQEMRSFVLWWRDQIILSSDYSLKLLTHFRGEDVRVPVTIASVDPLTVDRLEESSSSLQNSRAPEVSYPQREGNARTTLALIFVMNIVSILRMTCHSAPDTMLFVCPSTRIQTLCVLAVVQRFKSNGWFTEKNSTIVNIPIKNLEMTACKSCRFVTIFSLRVHTVCDVHGIQGVIEICQN